MLYSKRRIKILPLLYRSLLPYRGNKSIKQDMVASNARVFRKDFKSSSILHLLGVLVVSRAGGYHTESGENTKVEKIVICGMRPHVPVPLSSRSLTI